MKIQLKSLSLRNFKKVREFTIDFTERVTNIYGRNEAGKTTLFDAFLWLFFDKDSTDRKAFEIKTLDENNKAISKLEHEVIGVIDVDGQEIVIRKTYKENHTKKRGEAKEVFDGHVTDYYWNDVPCKKREFEQKISSLFNERIFKLITNTTYFNSLEWQDRRKVLIDIAGKIDPIDILNSIATPQNRTEIAELTAALNQKKSIEEYRREIVAKKKIVRDEIVMIPARVDEAKRQIPGKKDFDVIEYELKQNIDDLDGVESQISDIAKANQTANDSVVKLMNKKNDLSKKMMELEYAEKAKVQEAKHKRQAVISEKNIELRSITGKRSTLLTQHAEIKAELAVLESDVLSLRTRWEEEDKKQITFNENEFACPTCKTPYPEHQVEEKKKELQANFNTSKAALLKSIQEEGQAKGAKIADLKVKLSNIEADGSGLKDRAAGIEEAIKELQVQDERMSADDEAQLVQAIQSNTDYQALKSEREALSLQIEKPSGKADNSDLIAQKKSLQAQIDTLKSQLSEKGLRERLEQRINELEEQNATLNQQLATLEGIEFAILNYEKASMDVLEQRINGKFDLVKFKLFNTTIDGAETPTCITLVKGVPYPDVNTAGRIQAGLDIINALSDHYNIYGPVWVDNKESVTELPYTDSQLINLIVSPKDATLRVGSLAPTQESLFA